MAYCIKCGKEIKEDVKFCRFCGAPQDAVPASIPMTNASAPTTEKPRKFPVSIIVAVTIILAVIGFGYHWLQTRPAPNATASNNPASQNNQPSTHYTITDLNVSVIGVNMGVQSLNNKGQIVCVKNTGMGAGNRGISHDQAYIWEDGKTTPITPIRSMEPLGYSYIFPQYEHFNDVGQIAVGINIVRHLGGNVDQSYNQIFVYSEGTYKVITNEDKNSFILDFNNNGEILYHHAEGDVYDVYLWSNGQTNLIYSDSSSKFPEASLNDKGQVLIAGKKLVLWQNGVAKVLDERAAYSAHINNSGDIVVLFKGSIEFWHDGKKQLLDRSKGGVYRLTNLGQIFFWSNKLSIWQDGNYRDIDTLLPPSSGWTIKKVIAINESGQIIGSGTHNGVDNSSFFLSPQK